MTEYRLDPEAMDEFESRIKQQIIVELDAWGYLCPKCRSKIHYNRRERLYFCPPCEFVQTKAQYRETLNDIRLTLTRSGQPIQAVDRERELASIRSQRLAAQDDLSVVYYLRFRDVVKIGTTFAFKCRMLSLPWEEIIGIEPGDQKVERRRHKQFAEAHFMDEWFHQTDALATHVRSINFQNDEWRQRRFPGLPTFPWPRDTQLPDDEPTVTIERATSVLNC